MRKAFGRLWLVRGSTPPLGSCIIVTAMSEWNEEEKLEREIARLKSYYRYGVNNPFAGMHLRALQKKYPGVADAHFAKSVRDPPTPPSPEE
jgi:hypothetical protein